MGGWVCKMDAITIIEIILLKINPRCLIDLIFMIKGSQFTSKFNVDRVLCILIFICGCSEM